MSPTDNVVSKTAWKLEEFLKTLTKEEEEVFVAVMEESLSRARYLTDAAVGIKRAEEKALGGFLGGLAAPIGAKIVGGVIGHLAGGGSASTIPWGDICSNAIN